MLYDQQDLAQEIGGELRAVFVDGDLMNQESLAGIRKRLLENA